jgi:hypothetical protein
MVKFFTFSIIQPLRTAARTTLRLLRSTSVISVGQTRFVFVFLPTSWTASQKRNSWRDRSRSESSNGKGNWKVTRCRGMPFK